MTVHRHLRRAVLGSVVALAVGCSGGSKKDFVGTLCPTVRAWNDTAVDTVNAFSRSSPDASPLQRRALYAGTFAHLGDQLADLSARMERLPAPKHDADAVRSALRVATDRMRANLTDGMQRAAALDDVAYTYASVTDGTLFTGLEKNQAIIFQTLGDLADPFGLVPTECGRRGPVDLSPNGTMP